jgi:hypothetical protein
MKKTILIFCEGVIDQVFIADFLSHSYGETIFMDKNKNKRDKHKWDISFETNLCEGKIIETGGYTYLSKPIYLEQLKNNQTGRNLIIFDADEHGHGRGSFKNTEQSLKELKRIENVDFDYHLWPNHNDNGTVENLLIQLIPTDKKSIFNCFDQYNECLKQFQGLKPLDETLKRSLNSYTYNFNHADKASERNYLDTSFWDMNSDEKPDLKKLKEFLNKHFM